MKHTTFSKYALAFGLSGLACSGLARAKDPKIPGPNTYVRVLHAAIDGPKVDYFVNGDKKQNDVEFGALSKYQRFPAGYLKFDLKSNDPERTLLSSSNPAPANQFSTLVVYGTGWKVKGALYNDSTGWVANGKARIAFYNFSPGQTIDVLGTSINGNTYTLVHGLRYGSAKSVQVPPVEFTLSLVSRGVTINTVKGVKPRAGRRYAGYFIGRVKDHFKVLLDPTASQ